MRRALLAITVAYVAAITGSGISRADIVAPNASATVEGNTAGNFNSQGAVGVGQQVLFDIASSQFSTLTSGSVLTGIAFRPDVNLFPASAFGPNTLHNVTIQLATTSIAPTTNINTFGLYL